MGPYGTTTSSAPVAEGGSWLSKGGSPAAEIDGFLADAGFRVLSSDLRHVAQRLERLESTMIGNCRDEFGSAAEDDLYQQTVAFPFDAVHYNPSDLAAWVDSMLSEITPPCNAAAAQPVRQGTGDGDGDAGAGALPWASFPPEQQQATAAALPPPTYSQEEDSGIQLVHLMMTCAESVQRGDAAAAGSLIEEMRGVLARVGTRFGIGKVAGYFIDALTRRLYCPRSVAAASAVEGEILYHHFYESSPYLKFAHFTANQAILEAFDGHDRVHVIDFSLMHGLQWPALIQALALRPGGPPFLRLTGIGPPSLDGRDSLREIGLRLAELARSVSVRFAFRGVAANRIDDVQPWMLQDSSGPASSSPLPEEAVAVNSVMQLHRLLATEEDGDSTRIDSVLGWMKELRPKIVAVVEQEADHNKPGFLDRFTEALFYYSTIFDSLEGGGGNNGVSGGGGEQSAVAEIYLQREICNILCCEGAERVERHEPLARWRARMAAAGFRATHLGSNAFKQASMLLTLFSGNGYCVEEVDGCLTLGWHSRPLISASAWRVDIDEDKQLRTAALETTTATLTSAPASNCSSSAGGWCEVGGDEGQRTGSCE